VRENAQLKGRRGNGSEVVVAVAVSAVPQATERRSHEGSAGRAASVPDAWPSFRMWPPRWPRWSGWRREALDASFAVACAVCELEVSHGALTPRGARNDVVARGLLKRHRFTA
jgi:hypothetical protein